MLEFHRRPNVIYKDKTVNHDASPTCYIFYNLFNSFRMICNLFWSTFALGILTLLVLMKDTIGDFVKNYVYLYGYNSDLFEFISILLLSLLSLSLLLSLASSATSLLLKLNAAKYYFFESIYFSRTVLISYNSLNSSSCNFFKSFFFSSASAFTPSIVLF